MNRLIVATAALAAALFGAAPSLGAQPSGRCEVAFQGGYNTRSTLSKLPSGKFNTFVGGGFVGNCVGQDVTLRSDSAEYYGDQSLLYLIGNVRYAEPRVTVDSRTMTYWTAEQRLRADGDVNAVLPSGTTMRGPTAEYYRQVPGVRTEALMIATGRPQLAIVQPDSATGRPGEPVNVVADRITSRNDSLVYAGGAVRITRPELTATGDSAYLDNGTGNARLLLKPRVVGKGERPFQLTGGVIDLFSTARQVNRVIATPGGRAVSNDLQLVADSIDLRVSGNLLQRAVAWGKTRARAFAPDRDIVADSIDAVLPNQRVREIRAVRGAYATSIPDTATIRTTERDWMRGDTIVSRFDSVAARDSSRTPPIRDVRARGNARSFYHLANREGVKSSPGVNYVRGRNITVTFLNRAVREVTVVERATGVLLEASADSTGADRPAGVRGPRQGTRPGAPAVARPVTPPTPPARPRP